MSVPTFEEKIEGCVYRYWNCPAKFITPSMRNFLLVYRYYRDFPGAKMPDIYDVSDKFLFCYRYYESHYDKYARDVRNKQKEK